MLLRPATSDRLTHWTNRPHSAQSNRAACGPLPGPINFSEHPHSGQGLRFVCICGMILLIFLIGLKPAPRTLIALRGFYFSTCARQILPWSFQKNLTRRVTAETALPVALQCQRIKYYRRSLRVLLAASCAACFFRVTAIFGSRASPVPGCIDTGAIFRQCWSKADRAFSKFSHARSRLG